METKIHPSLEEMCRLCLKENSGVVNIFPKEKSSDKYASLSIPMRIMTCAALEVQVSDDFPKKICRDCRLQLEKSYYFRKQSQASDTKLRKHFRLISMGKVSKVFLKKTDEDDDDELEFQDTIEFIKEHEEEEKQKDKLKFDALINEMKLENEQNLQKIRENMRTKCREELTPEIRAQLRDELIPEIVAQVKNELRIEVENELEDQLRKEISEQCLREAKESLRNDVYEECRQLEIKNLLNDLQSYLTNKKRTLNCPTSVKEIVPRPHSPENDKSSTENRKNILQNSQTLEVIEMSLDKISNENIKKGSIILTNNVTENNINASDDECDSEGNFLIYDTDEGFEVQKKEKNQYSNNDITETEYEIEDYIDPNSGYEKLNDENIGTNEESGGNSTITTSYQIEDNENGEIQFLKKSNDTENHELDEGNVIHSNENIMIINFPEAMDTDYVEEIKEDKLEKAKRTTKPKKLCSKNAKSSTMTTIKSTFETTVLEKTYVNPNQRNTDTPKIFKCKDCPMVFSTKPSFERHLRTHQKLEKSGITYQCPECRIVVSCSSALRRHMNVHCDEKPFACFECGKTFVQKEILKRHMQTHTGIKPHQCPHCERAFAQRINLTQHINRTHLEEPRIKFHSCHLCPKRFNHASGLSRHLTTHSGISFQCSECDRAFGDRSSIKRHIVSMHSNVKKDETKDT
ncbi:uncharacterized protein ACRADG_000685 [Cochliomyia hominivorax]